ncbi:ABC transporter ATP-binding protein [Deinococcus koreensis]|uniref:ABC transporter ATP-binding protein n=1 Tax=Deinococcus koreensis TaxID=2054903 RepID=A0A2K3UUW4_9DEIO|nr:ABC transporter ATP-binding protein [Deinococcus koreensis]PNY80326.1 ABC transporter ATP-binding protein [Deinococcus koreensis]
MSQLHVEHVTLTFGGLNALSDVSLSVPEGEIVSIIGPNGAGKTSLLNCISGFYHPTRGRISYGEHDLSRAAPNVVTSYGIARAFQNLELFRGLNVVENLLLARHTHLKYSLLDSLVYYGRASRREAENRAYVERIIDFMELEEHRAHPVGTLAYGIQKRVEVARALTLAPSLLLLDEPMAGMNVEEKEDMVRFVLDIGREHGITVVLIEHDLGVVMDISDRVYVLDFGQLIASGTPAEVSADPRVIEAYTGVAGHDPRQAVGA